MRLVFLGASPLTQMTAKELIDAEHEVVIIERDLERIDDCKEHLDCAFLNGDGSKPDILKEADPGNTDILFCVTGHDQTNIIASLIAKSLGVKRVVTLVEDSDFLPICEELKLEHTLIPIRTISRQLINITEEE